MQHQETAQSKSRATKSREKETSVIETSPSDEAQELEFFLQKTWDAKDNHNNETTQTEGCATHMYLPNVLL